MKPHLHYNSEYDMWFASNDKVGIYAPTLKELACSWDIFEEDE